MDMRVHESKQIHSKVYDVAIENNKYFILNLHRTNPRNNVKQSSTCNRYTFSDFNARKHKKDYCLKKRIYDLKIKKNYNFINDDKLKFVINNLKMSK